MIGRISVIAALMFSACVHSAAPVPGEQLLAQCEAYIARPDSDVGQLCEAYVRGFLEGVQARAQYAVEEESWSDRAVRTRLGRNALARTSSCVPRTLSFDDLIDKAIVYLRANEQSLSQPAGAALEATLIAHYPCVKRD
jgi:hypothetical protein